jgi:predicted HicB family RNase H-like nuclease
MTETDNRVDIEIELADEEWFTLMKIAHEQDITLNQLVERVLTAEIDRLDKEQS